MDKRRRAQRLQLTEPEPEPPAVPRPAPLLAVVAQWTGREARALRVALRMSLETFADRVQAGRSTVCDWEAAGPKLILSWGMQNALDTLLTKASDEVKKRFGMLVDGKTRVSVSDSGGLEPNGDNADRTQALRIIGGTGLAVASAPLEALERFTELGTLVRVDDRYLDDLESRGTALRASYASAASFELLRRAREHASGLAALLEGELLPRQRTRLIGLLGDTALLIAWLYMDLEQRIDAHAYVRFAADLARKSADNLLSARVLRCRSTLASAVPRGGLGGHPPMALRLAEEASAALPPHAHPHTCLQVFAREAVERAASRDPARCRRLLDDAAKALAAVRSADPDRLAAEALVSVEGLCLVLLGRASDATEVLTGAARHVSPGGARAIVLADLARAHVLQGEPEQACAALTIALGEATLVRYLNGVGRILGVRAAFDNRWVELACVREFDGRLRAFVG